MNAVTDIVEVYDLLYRLGFSATNTAFFHLSYSVYLASLNPHWLVKPSQGYILKWQTNTTPIRFRSSETLTGLPAPLGTKTLRFCAVLPAAR